MSKNFKNATNTYKSINHKSFDQFSNDYNKSLKKSHFKIKSSDEQFSGLLPFLMLLLMFVLVGNYLRTGMSFDFTFKGFIEFLSKAPSFDISWSIVDLTIYGDWGVFNFFKDFFNWFTDIFEVCITLFGMIIESIHFIFYFVKGLLFT